MLNPSWSLAAAAASVGVLAAAVPALAARAPAPLRLTATNPILAGETVTVTWDAPDAEGFDEMELVLSLDGGRTWPIRVTRDLSPRATETAFRVPSLPAEEAIVALRAGRKGEKESEEILVQSVLFRIRVPVFSVAETLRQVGGEWRTVDAMDGQTPDGPDVAVVLGTPSLSPEAGNGPEADGGGDEDLSAHETESPLPYRSGARIMALSLTTAVDRPLLSRRE